MKDKKIVVWFSCGAASAVAAKRTIEKYGADNDVIVVNMPIKQEHEDNQRFANDVEKWLGQPIERIFHPKYKGGVRLVRHKGKRIFLDELPEDATGRPIKDMDFECGIFCETPKKLIANLKP